MPASGKLLLGTLIGGPTGGLRLINVPFDTMTSKARSEALLGVDFIGTK
jgi:hypothetical protein